MAKPTRLLAIEAATPGWWAEYRDSDIVPAPEVGSKAQKITENGKTIYSPVAFWQIVEEHELDSGGVIVPDSNRLRMVQGVDPTGAGWAGESCEEVGNFIQYVYSPGKMPESREVRS